MLTPYTVTFTAEVWLYPGETASWHFITLPRKESDAIKLRSGPTRRGWGALKVTATIRSTSWQTSIFPDKTRGYLLPLKADVRKKEKLAVGQRVEVKIEL